jgi:DeoR family transcriptional regulator, aga operon transcriptional repressor
MLAVDGANTMNGPPASRLAIRESSSMLVGERRQYILSLIESNGRVLVSELSESLGMSVITIRHDLDFLESKRLVQRTYGGAFVPRNTTLFDLFFKGKERHRVKEEQLMAAAAVALVQEGQCVLLDSGSTTTLIARALRKFSHLTIVTNAVNIAAELGDTDFEIILVGGNLRKNSSSLVGPFAEDVLREIHADILFLGVDGFDTQIGITTPYLLEGRVNRAMVKASKKVVVACDSAKFGRCSLTLVVSPSSIHTVITDTQIRAADSEALKSVGVEIILIQETSK